MASAAGMPSPDAAARPRRQKRDRKETVRLVAAIVALALLVAFVLDNSSTVKVGFVFFSAHVSLIWVLLIAAFLGALIDRLAIVLHRRREQKAPPRP